MNTQTPTRMSPDPVRTHSLKTPLRFAQLTLLAFVAMAVSVSAQTAGKKPNILVIFGDDIGTWNVSAYSLGMMGKTSNIDRIGKEGIIFTDHYGPATSNPERT